MAAPMPLGAVRGRPGRGAGPLTVAGQAVTLPVRDIVDLGRAIDDES